MHCVTHVLHHMKDKKKFECFVVPWEFKQMEKGEQNLVLTTNLSFSVSNNNIFYHIYLFSCILLIKPCVGPNILWMLGQSLLRGYFVYNIFHLVILNCLLCFYFLISFLKSSHSSSHPCCNFQHVLCGFISCLIVIFIN